MSVLYCWRCGEERSSLVGGCAGCGRSLPRQRTGRWNRNRSSPWQLSIGGEHFGGLNHSAMMWYVVRAAIERGIPPEMFSRHHVGHENTRWLSVQGTHDLSSFCVRAQEQWGRREH